MLVATLRYFVAFVVLPSALFLVLKHQYFIIRGLVDLDYLLAGVVMPWLGGWIAGLIVLVAFLFDILLAMAPAFHFRGGAFLEQVTEIGDIELWYVIFITLAFGGGGVFYSWLSIRIAGSDHRKARLASLVMLLLIPLFVVADGITTGNAFMKSNKATLPFNIATSSVFETVRSGYRWLSYEPSMESPRIAAATDGIRTRLKNGEKLPPNIVLVIAESMGIFHDPAAQDLFLQAINKPEIRSRYSLSIGTVPYFYSTVPGEIRELCGILKATTDPRPDEMSAEECLPKKLQALGYETAAAHGFAGSFFNRNRWYPWLGFEQVYFGPELEQSAGSRERCGVAFFGVCDDIAMDVLHKHLVEHSSSQQFIYWVTLNAHTPFPEVKNRYPKPDCSKSEPTRNHAELCRLVGIYNLVVNAVAESALDSRTRETAYIVVGDHPPPLVRRNLRDYFDDTKVPYFILWPRGYGVYEPSTQNSSLTANNP